MRITLELKKTILGVLQEAGRRPMSPEALATYANAQMDAPVTAEQVRAALARCAPRSPSWSSSAWCAARRPCWTPPRSRGAPPRRE